MNLLHALSDAINKFIRYWVCVFLAVILAVMFYAVVMRYVFNDTPVWADELARYCFVWLQMLAATIATKKSTHTKISLLSDRLKGKWKKSHTFIMYVIIFVVSCYIFSQSLLLVYYDGETMTSTLPFSMFWVYICIPFSALVMILHVFSNMARLFWPDRTSVVGA